MNLFSGLVINATLTKWFIARRGWALAIGSAGVSLAGIITPITMTGIVDNFGWRFGYLALAGGVIALIVPVALVMRRQPEDVGLLPDGGHQRFWGHRREDSGCYGCGRSSDPYEAPGSDDAGILASHPGLRVECCSLRLCGYVCDSIRDECWFRSVRRCCGVGY